MKRNPKTTLVAAMTATALFTKHAAATNFGDDTAFLKQHTELIVLSDKA
jgi:hypothetical protein